MTRVCEEPPFIPSASKRNSGRIPLIDLDPIESKVWQFNIMCTHTLSKHHHFPQGSISGLCHQSSKGNGGWIKTAVKEHAWWCTRQAGLRDERESPQIHPHPPHTQHFPVFKLMALYILVRQIWWTHQLWQLTPELKRPIICVALLVVIFPLMRRYTRTGWEGHMVYHQRRQPCR